MNKNEMTMLLQSRTVNEALARSAVAAFCSELNPTIDTISDIKTAVSEAVNNAIVHGYNGQEDKMVKVFSRIVDTTLHIEISDTGIGIADIKKALEPFFTTKQDEERTGMGFTVMESFMDTLEVKSDKNGTTVYMTKKIVAD